MREETVVVLLRKIQKLEQDLKHHPLISNSRELNILESMGRSVYIFDVNHRIIYWNQMSQSLYGYSRAEALGKTAPEIIIEHKYSHLATLIIQRALRGETWSGQFPVRTKYGHTFSVITTLSPCRDQHATTFGVTCVCADARSFQQSTPFLSKISSHLNFKPQHHININTPTHLHKLKGIISWPWKLGGTNQNTHNNPQHPQTTTKTTHIHLDHVHISWEDLIIQEQIGKGSRGTVYHALLYGSDVAVKIFSTQKYPDDVIRSFRKEVSLMRRLRHPNILLFMGAVISPQYLCIVTEFLPRGSLFRLLQQHNIAKLDWRRRVHMAMDIARGMNYLHHCQPPIIHRNLKSSNLLVDKNLTLKVGDFGLSRIKHATYLTTNTRTGAPHWMAPEILRNEHVDEKSDVYSYGVVLWEITTGKIPWENLNSLQVIGAVGFMNQRLEIPNDVDPHWASLIQSCWSREPQSRPTFQEILIKLKDLQKKFTMQLKGTCRDNSSTKKES